MGRTPSALTIDMVTVSAGGFAAAVTATGDAHRHTYDQARVAQMLAEHVAWTKAAGMGKGVYLCALRTAKDDGAHGRSWEYAVVYGRRQPGEPETWVDNTPGTLTIYEHEADIAGAWLAEAGLTRAAR